MIHPSVAARFYGDNGVDLANFELEARFTDGERRRVVLRLGHPFQRGEPTCTWIRSELENLDSTEGPLAASDAMQAIVLGLQWMIARLETYQAKHGCKYYWTGEEYEFDFRSHLGTDWQRPTGSEPSAPS